MSKANTWETGLNNLLFANLNFAGVGDAGGLRGSAAAGNLYLSLHAADPGEVGDQTTSEITYTSYARVATARDGVAWGVGGAIVTLGIEVAFPKGTGGTGTATHVGVGTASAGAGKLLYKGALTPNIVCGNGITPKIPVSPSSTITED